MNEKTLKQLEKLKESIDNKIEEREITFEERSEKWQESEKGDFYDTKTQELQYVVDSLESTIEELKTYLG